MAEKNNKDLLKLEADTNSKSKLLVCKKDGLFPQPEAPREKPTMFPLPQSQVLGKVKDFLGVFSESNKKLQNDAKENPENYDIEVLNGKESEYIEMDLMLGVADLHTPEAVAAAESVIAGYQPAIPSSSSDSESEDSSDDEDDGNGEDKTNEQQDHDEAGSESVKFGSKNVNRDSSRKQKPKKRPKIVELS